MDLDELALWMARDRESPLGMERHDFHAAQVAAAVGGGKIVDLMPKWGQSSSDDPDVMLNDLMGGP
ncbi:hypothetical protein PQS31_01600 [Luteimonas sp BLCC-B24]|uniref:phage tail assembly protein T n=1 Tax=Luteimonas sp. BLCC-B24 TaxID=3025317 RepID=UPI00234C125D|nr:hypothetical protein [Luteimonas sp. BLCC-B24]MDC7805525.1 hypothetical protein [Luteimonas sp. BLCC-B24]